MDLSEAFEGLTTTVTPGRRMPGKIGMGILLICWLTLGVLPFVVAVPDFQLATGKIGTPGTLTVVSCVSLGQGRYDCKGRFVPDSGGDAVPVAASPDSEAGDVTRAQLTPEGDRALPSGTKGVLRAMTLPATGLVVLAFLPYVLLYVFKVRRGRRTSVIAGSVVATLSLVLIVIGLVAATS
ncbi:hypothetical protein [Microbispora amethystogenes]|uniref:Uncharacterized protein n=1 Tax=Microbispora amethystogenes TaxID=1427754 RepID=A0ABQ4FMM5_9ACTN|nr:hypothetical protein [Microbispora amethystogenes]GIH36073.1 hypothetical protein Mam01_62370 [Microbispora amethystogenes]